jgi:hypothetical protein
LGALRQDDAIRSPAGAGELLMLIACAAIWLTPIYRRIGQFLASDDATNYLPVLHYQLTRCTATFAPMQISLGAGYVPSTAGSKALRRNHSYQKSARPQPKCFDPIFK